jgi:hypothetical protein
MHLPVVATKKGHTQKHGGGSSRVLEQRGTGGDAARRMQGAGAAPAQVRGPGLEAYARKQRMHKALETPGERHGGAGRLTSTAGGRENAKE